MTYYTALKVIRKGFSKANDFDMNTYYNIRIFKLLYIKY